ncbi:MAG: polysaccharide biosynthesis protein [Peptococcaceae bacterium]|jgi:stage V sporulation protein B|nr:polysaccharide biosynthesis protein [Peptococcaceae bacterium]MBQ2021727.1 polysaccharide biosynthesis protein [Peptococcaceae bacterium]
MKNKLLQGTVVLLCSSVVLRCLGFLYQILVVRIAGTESLGILNMTMPFYMLLVVIATMGMPIAITKLTAQYVASHGHFVIGQMMRTAFLLVLALSCGCLLAACILMPKVFSLLHTDARVSQCFVVLIPGIVIVPFCSVMRGYFQGMQQMVYPSVGQIVEQLIRVFCGIAFLLWVSPKDVLSMAMSLGAAAMLGEAGGCAFLAVMYLHSRRKAIAKLPNQSVDRKIQWMKPLLSLGIPVTATRLTSTVDMAIEASIVPFCLIASGHTINEAAAIYGQFSGVAVSLLTIPTVLTGALSTALIPAISEVAATGRKKALQQYCGRAVSVTWAFSLPIIFMLYLYGEEFGQMLFHIEGLGEMMRWLSFGAVFVYLGQTVVGILQGLGMTRTVFINNFCGSAAKLIGMYYCIRTMGLGATGIACGMILGYGLQCMMHIAALGQCVPVRIPWKQIFLPVGGSLLMVIQMQFLETVLPNGTIWFFVRLTLAAVSYLLILLITGELRQLMKTAKK